MKTTSEKVIALYAVCALCVFGHASANYRCQLDEATRETLKPNVSWRNTWSGLWLARYGRSI